MKRIDIINKTNKELFDLIDSKHGSTKANDLINRETSRIFQKEYPLEYVIAVNREAMLRVLSGQFERVELNFELWKKQNQ